MSNLQSVTVTLLFIISTFSVLGAGSGDPVVINNQTYPVPVTEVNNNGTTGSPNNSSTTPVTPTEKPTTPVTPIPTPKPTTIPITTPASNSSNTTTSAPITSTSTTTISPPTTTTVAPNVTTAKPTGAPPTTPVPSHRRFDGPSFIGGIVLALGLVAIGFVAFKFYKARTELNYHTL